MNQGGKTHPDYPGYLVFEDGRVFSSKTNKFLKTRPRNNELDYWIVRLFINKPTREYVHRMVAKCFIENINNYPQVNHLDGNKSNNLVSNLEWTTGSENMKHSYKMGLQSKSRINTKIGIDRAHQICNYIDRGLRNCEISKLVNVHPSYISWIRTGSGWYEVSKNYNFKRNNHAR